MSDDYSHSYRDLVILRGEVVHLSLRLPGREQEIVSGDTIRLAYERGKERMRRRHRNLTPKLIEQTLIEHRRDPSDRVLAERLYSYADALHRTWCEAVEQSVAPAEIRPLAPCVIEEEISEAWIAQMYLMIGMPELLIRPARLHTLPI